MVAVGGKADGDQCRDKQMSIKGSETITWYASASAAVPQPAGFLSVGATT
jgi:hypothetical protein